MMIKITDLNFSYKKKETLTDINLKIAKGEFFALTGLNGAGKTTLIKLILDLLRTQQNNNIIIAGSSSWLVETKVQIAYLPEKFNIKGSLSAKTYFKLLSGVYKKDFRKEDIRNLCHKLSLDPEALSRPSSSYSKGMLQKVGLIGCFLCDTPLLLFDEPLSGLDPLTRYQVKELLLEVKQTGNKTLFYNSHILSDVEELCDRFAILHNQKIIYEGQPRSFIEKYESDDLETAYIKCLNKLK